MLLRRLAASLTAFLFVAGLTSVAQAQEKKKEHKLTKQEQQDAQTLLKLADAGTGPSELPVVWEQHHFVKAADGKTFVPFTIKADTKTGVALYVRAVSKAAPAAPAAKDAKDKKIEFPWDDIQFIEVVTDGRFSRALSVAPGDYDLYVGVKEKSTGKKGEVTRTTLLKRDLSVPDFTKPELKISSVVLAENVEAAAPLDMEAQRANPYTFAGMKVTPSLEGKFAKAGELNLVFWIYGVSPTSMQKPDVQVEYSFSRKTGEEWKYFNKTAPQMLNGQTFPPEFSLAVGHLVTGSLSIPLASFETGDYRLEIKVTDKVSSKSITENVSFNVGA
ncbi:MAG: hypothetical protein ABL971_12655 [Vicinamibacterales bacterium]